MSESLIRVERLKSYQRSRQWSDSELARQLGRSPSQVHAWYTGERNIGERLARSIEEDLKLPRLYLDERDEVGKRVAAREPIPLFKASRFQPSGKRGALSIPVLPWDRLVDLLTKENVSLGGDLKYLETFADPSSTAKFVEMNDDSMAAEFQPGDHLLLDPAVIPRAGDIVLVRLAGGEHLVRKFLPKAGAHFDAEALNPNYARLSSAADGLQILATMTEHRRYRRR